MSRHTQLWCSLSIVAVLLLSACQVVLGEKSAADKQHELRIACLAGGRDWDSTSNTCGPPSIHDPSPPDPTATAQPTPTVPPTATARATAAPRSTPTPTPPPLTDEERGQAEAEAKFKAEIASNFMISQVSSVQEGDVSIVRGEVENRNALAAGVKIEVTLRERGEGTGRIVDTQKFWPADMYFPPGKTEPFKLFLKSCPQGCHVEVRVIDAGWWD